ncbi:acyl-CoA synthetase [Parahaliea mediterranea]|uniref:Acyl-CoA synthetase n=1 Tax=Parahaliea mediterranea TaxID=651086 RepID=A0A939DE24_9GAMM|nr:acyl-CoA synthetase [Parahaliea mediterranea]MBN7796181.1 acyl-CoA synthetase [Parahaliea mediterranea]
MSDTAANLKTASDLTTFEASPRMRRYPLTNTLELIVSCSERYRHDTALEYLPTAARGETGIRVSFLQLAERVIQTANLFTSLGVRPEDAISLLLPNLPETHYALWGGQAVGIASPINPFLEAGHIVEIMNATRAKVLVTQGPGVDRELWSKVGQVMEKVPTLETVLVVDAPGDTAGVSTGIRTLNFNDSITQQAADALAGDRAINDNDIAAYFHTGGTTGRPKIARLTHGNIAFVSQVYADCTAEKGRYAMLCGLPLFHIFGTVAAGIASLFAGRSLVITTPQGFRSPNVLPNWWHLVERYQVKSFAAVPAILDALLQMPAGDCDIGCLQEITCGASPLHESLKQAFENKFNVAISNGYGMTESSCLLARPSSAADTPPNSVGSRLPYMEMQIAHVDGNRRARQCAAGEIGDILARGPHIFAGYLNPQDNAGAWVEERWFNTGDMGYMDDDGFLYLTGRSKDLIIRGGHNIDPALIEEPLGRHPAVATAVAIGQPDAYAGELPIAYVTLKAGHRTTVQALDEHCKATVSERAAVPKRIVILEKMPLTAVNKIYKPELRNLATEWVILDMLSKKSINASVKASMDTKLGQLARVQLQEPGHNALARETLARLPVHIELI